MDQDINTSNYSILVVDDDLLVRNVLKKYITSLGFYVDTAEDGKTALEMLNTFSYDLVMTDLQMPALEVENSLQHVKGFPEHTQNSPNWPWHK
jgi:CheY-like chemotaxis protein